ncbi:MAG: polyphosphate polymerase domain-containing protein [Blautia sp.]|nr:polyphosphate polymerase domain-containing protein [Blautia sp.]MCM1202124.1 polyphosphate polymerase domain-containing protein [Bacteroides fragilis]
MNKRYRNEWKYCCSAKDADMIRSRLSAVLCQDIHSGDNGKYEVHSLYFDDYRNSCAKENDAGVSTRFKYRIRYYGKQCGSMKLECKEKRNGYCHKESCPVSMEEYRMIMEGKSGGLFWRTEEPLLKKFCVCCMTRQFMPKAIIDYERTAYTEDISNIRITLDENISVSDDFSHFPDGDYMRYPVQEKERYILEVKFDDIMPGYIRHIVTNRRLVLSAFSKYCVGRKKIQSMGR